NDYSLLPNEVRRQVAVRVALEHQGSIQAVLKELCQTAKLEGIAIIDRSQPGEPVTYSAGVAGIDTIEAGRSLLAANPGQPSHARANDARTVLACPWSIPPARLGGLVLWRSPGAPGWGTADYPLGRDGPRAGQNGT